MPVQLCDTLNSYFVLGVNPLNTHEVALVEEASIVHVEAPSTRCSTSQADSSPPAPHIISTTVSRREITCTSGAAHVAGTRQSFL